MKFFDPSLIFIATIFLFFFVVIPRLCIKHERKIWNNGISPAGKPWRSFDVDSAGDHGYTDNCGNYIWISWIKHKIVEVPENE